jgi:hypothetical protein
MSEITTAYCWTTLAASIVVALAAVAGLIADRYKDTLLECVGLAMVAMSGFVVSSQIVAHGAPQGSGVAFMATSVAVFAVAHLIKVMAEPQKHSTEA